MGIIDRIKLFIDYKGISMRQFCITLGIANGAFSKVKSIGSETLSKIIYAFPDLNMIWLITGDGEMLARSEQYNNAKIELYKESISEKDKRIEDLVRKNAILTVENDRLQSELKKTSAISDVVANISNRATRHTSTEKH